MRPPLGVAVKPQVWRNRLLHDLPLSPLAFMMPSAHWSRNSIASCPPTRKGALGSLEWAYQQTAWATWSMLYGLTSSPPSELSGAEWDRLQRLLSPRSRLP